MEIVGANISSVCVFCGSRVGVHGEPREAAQDLGEALAAENMRLIYGGGGIGLMGVIARSVMAAGGETVGIIPHALSTAEVALEGLTKLEVVVSMSERKRRMFELADAFVALPGGLGTLDEVLEAITLQQLDIHDKPMVLIDFHDHWAPFHALLQSRVDEGFADESSLDFCTTVNSVEDAIATLKAAPAPRKPAQKELY